MARRDKSILRLDAVRVEGALIQPDVLALAAAGAADGQEEAGYGIDPGLNLRDEIGRAYRIAHAMWKAFEDGRGGAHSWDVHKAFTTGILTKVLGFTLATKREFTSRTSTGFELLQAADGPVPVTIAGAGGIDQVGSVATVGDDTVRRSATTLLQGELNSGEGGLWGLATNGPTWRILRDNESITRPGYIEVDLARIFRDDLYSEFTAFWLLAHRSRFPHADAASSDCPLERWRQLGREQGVTARDDLRDGVQAALFQFGRGFLENPANAALIARLNSVKEDRLTSDDFFRQLLRLIYRLIFVMTAEDREILHPHEAPEAGRLAYTGGYATGRLRERARNKLNWDRHHDAFQGVKAVFRALSRGEPKLALPALGGLFGSEQTPDIDAAQLTNNRFLVGLYHLAWLRREGALARINWRDMETEEFGSVYESLLELTPQVTEGGTKFSFVGEADEDKATDLLGKASGKKGKGGAKGNQRKTTGSYYTPDSLVQLLLNEALDPVIARKVAENPTDAEALLKLKVIDPACGSGHFVLAAARRIARRLAELRHAGSPTLGQYRHALRDVARHCIHGVDRNPMAVELCKVAIWIETIEPGKPLTFMDQKIRCGDSLLGVFDLACLAKGIPDEAYAPLSGDSKVVASHFRRINAAQKDNSKTQGSFDFVKPPAEIFEKARKIEEMAEDSLEQVVEKRTEFETWQHNGWIDQKRACDLWTAAFVLPKVEIPTPAGDRLVPTSVDVWLAWSGSHQPDSMAAAVESAAKEGAFLHWPLVFADVMAAGGFDCVIGNPPWESLSPDAKEFYSKYDPEVRFLSPEDQKARINYLNSSPGVQEAWDVECRRLYVFVNFLKSSGRFKLFSQGNMGKGDFNIYRMFVEAGLSLTRKSGVVAQFVPENLYNGANAAAIRLYLFENCHLRKLIGFENSGRVWFDIDTRAKFCLYVASLGGSTSEFSARFGVRSEAEVKSLGANPSINVPLALVREFSPDALAITEIMHAADITVARKLYTRFPKFGARVHDLPTRHALAELHMGNDRDGFTNDPTGLPIYEGRMVEAFDHRAKAWISGRGRASVWQELAFDSENKGIKPQWRILQNDIPSKLNDRWSRYRVGFCNVASPTNQRALVATLIPPNTICGDTVPTIEIPDGEPECLLFLVAVMNAICMDFIVKPKVSLHMSFTVLDSLPLPRVYHGTRTEMEVVRRTLLLTALGSEMDDFWRDVAPRLGFDLSTHRVVEEPSLRRRLRAEIDVLIARDIFGLTLDEMRYILKPSDVLKDKIDFEPFGALMRAEQREFKTYLTRDLILEAWSRLPFSAAQSLAAA